MQEKRFSGTSKSGAYNGSSKAHTKTSQKFDFKCLLISGDSDNGDAEQNSSSSYNVSRPAIAWQTLTPRYQEIRNPT